MKCEVEPCNCLICTEKCLFFTRLDPGELEILNKAKRAIKYKKGEMILKKGSFNPLISLVSSGYVKMSLEGDNDKRFVLEILGSQDFLSYDVFGDGYSRFSGQAMTETVVCHLNVSVFLELLERNGRFCADVMKYINTHNDIRYARLRSVTLKQTRGKLADVIIYIDGLNHGGEVFKTLSRKDISDMANISMENAIRTLHDFESEGIIRTDKKDVVILEHDALVKISVKG